MSKIANAIVLGAAILSAKGASATTYDFTFTTSVDTAAGQFTTVAAAPSMISAISGTFDGAAITGLSPYASADNILQASYPFASFSGISFTANNIDYNLYGNGPAFLTNSVTDPTGTGTGALAVTSLSVNAIPEPAMSALMIVGIAITGFTVRRRRATSLA